MIAWGRLGWLARDMVLGYWEVDCVVDGLPLVLGQATWADVVRCVGTLERGQLVRVQRIRFGRVIDEISFEADFAAHG